MKRTAILIGLAAMMLFGCEKKEAQPTGETSGVAAAEAQPESGTFSLKIKVNGTQAVFETEGAPKPDEVGQRLTDGLYATPAFEANGPRKLEGTVTYDIQKLPNDGGIDLVLLGGLHSPQVKLNTGVNLQSTDERWKGKPIAEMVDGAIELFVARIAAQGRVMGGDDSTLAAILADTKESPDALLMAIQEVRERRLEKLIPQVKPYLAEGQEPALRLAACATLVGLGDDSERTQILKVAEDFSRDRDPRMVPLLHILGDLGGDEAITYLQTVAEAHSAPAVRAVAQEALAKAKGEAAPAH